MAPGAVFRQIKGSAGFVYDYFTDESLIYKNALLTAEGLISIITNKIPLTINGLKIAITGYEADGLTIVDQSTVHLTQGTGTLKLYFESLSVWLRRTFKLALVFASLALHPSYSPPSDVYIFSTPVKHDRLFPQPNCQMHIAIELPAYQ